MPDIFTQRKRSAVMAAIRSHGNKATELRLIQIFRAHGITGWRRSCSLALGMGSRVRGLASVIRTRKPQVLKPRTKNLPARSTGRVKPDFVFPKLKTAVFVDGCFWHGCPKHATWPKTNRAFWRKKIARNMVERDREVGHALRRAGWRVIRVWEHGLRRKDEARLLRRLRRQLGGTSCTKRTS